MWGHVRPIPNFVSLKQNVPTFSCLGQPTSTKFLSANVLILKGKCPKLVPSMQWRLFLSICKYNGSLCYQLVQWGLLPLCEWLIQGAQQLMGDEGLFLPNRQTNLSIVLHSLSLMFWKFKNNHFLWTNTKWIIFPMTELWVFLENCWKRPKSTIWK